MPCRMHLGSASSLQHAVLLVQSILCVLSVANYLSSHQYRAAAFQTKAVHQDDENSSELSIMALEQLALQVAFQVARSFGRILPYETWCPMLSMLSSSAHLLRVHSHIGQQAHTSACLGGLHALRYRATSRTPRSQITFLRQGLAGEDQTPAEDMLNERKKYISDSIRGVPDFPIKGINFHDVTTMLLDPVAFKYSIQDFAERYRDKSIDAIAGFEARGFIYGAALSYELGIAFVPLRKPGKLPGETISAEYKLEYGSDKIEMHVGAVKEGQRVLLIDDLIATGGTLAAGISLIEKVGATVVEAACVIEMPALKGRAKLGSTPLYTQIDKEGE